MKRNWQMKRYAMILATIFLAGCDGGAKPAQVSVGAPGSSVKRPDAPPEVAPASTAKGTTTSSTEAVASSPTSVLGSGGSAELSPANTKIEFVGKHVGEKPDPRLGGFEKFTGKISVDVDTKALTAITFDITADSLWTQMADKQMADKLTGHLKSPDFFDVKEYPEIKFQSTKIDGDAVMATVVGDLTLHGITKSVTVPVTIKDAADGKMLVAGFTIDRTEFGMTYGDGKVENVVELTVVIGEKTAPKSAEPAPAS